MTVDEKIERMLAECNGRACMHTINSARAVHGVGARAEEKLARLGVTRSNRVGATVVYRPGGPGGAYKYDVITTRICLKRNTRGWRLTGASRAVIRARIGEQFIIRVTLAAARDIIREAFDGVYLSESAMGQVAYAMLLDHSSEAPDIGA